MGRWCMKSHDLPDLCGGGCWVEYTGSCLPAVCGGVGAGLCSGNLLWLFASHPSGTGNSLRFGICNLCRVGISVLRLCGVSGGSANGLFCRAHHRRHRLGQNCGMVAATCFCRNLAYRGKTHPPFWKNSQKIMDFCKISLCKREKMGYNIFEKV